MQHCLERHTQDTLKSMRNGLERGDFYDVYERMTYVYTFEKPKVWIF